MGSLPSLPSPVRAGQPITADAFNRLLEAVKMATVINGVGIRVSRTMQGTVVSASAQPRQVGGAVSAALQHPFQLLDASTEEDPLFYRVRYGTVNDIAPTDVATDVALTDDATNYIFVKLTLDVEGDITAAIIDENTTGLPADDDDYAHILLGTIVCADELVTEINQAVTHSLRFTACGRTNDGEEPPVLTERGTYEFWGV